jgi:hypothetical protein
MEHKPKPFEEGALAAMRKLAEALRAIHKRLIVERYTIVDGKYIPPKEDQNQ